MASTVALAGMTRGGGVGDCSLFCTCWCWVNTLRAARRRVHAVRSIAKVAPHSAPMANDITPQSAISMMLPIASPELIVTGRPHQSRWTPPSTFRGNPGWTSWDAVTMREERVGRHSLLGTRTLGFGEREDGHDLPVGPFTPGARESSPQRFLSRSLVIAAMQRCDRRYTR